MVTFTRKIDMSPGVQGSGDIVYADHINELQIAIEQVQSGAAPIALAGIEGALGEYAATSGNALYNAATRVFDMRAYADQADPLNAAITAAASAGGGDVYVVSHTRSTPIIVPSGGIRLIGAGAVQRWRGSTPAKVTYTGSTAALVVEGSTTGTEGIEICRIHLDGDNASAGTSGIVLDADASASHYIESVLLDSVTITNFPAHQLRSTGVVYDVTLRRVTCSDQDNPGDDLIILENAFIASQWRLFDCFLANYGVGSWAFNAATVPSDNVFVGGTVVSCAANNGIWSYGGTTLLGVHVEGQNATHSSTIGVRHTGPDGAFIAPASCAFFGIGVQIGDGTVTSARGWTVAGSVGNNNDGVGGCDIEITAGGARLGTILGTGYSDGEPVIRNLRQSTDGVQEVRSFVSPPSTVTGSRGGNAALASLLTALQASGLIVDGSS